MRYYVAADIHGFLTPYLAALKAAGYFADRGEKKLLICGDLFDRGHEAEEVQAFVLEQLAEGRLILIRGNHEDLFCDFVGKDGGRAFRHHVLNGTYQTALDLTGWDLDTARMRRSAFAKAAGNTPYYREIIPKMLDYYETRRYIFVHGWIPCFQEGEALYSPCRDWRSLGVREWTAARWINGIDAANAGATVAEKTIVCGHWHCSYGHSRYEGKGSEYGEGADFSPYYAPGIIALDACTAISGRVNVIVLED